MAKMPAESGVQSDLLEGFTNLNLVGRVGSDWIFGGAVVAGR
jgi:hypothetical protein